MKSRQAKSLHRAGGKSLVENVVDTALQWRRPNGFFVVVGHQARTCVKPSRRLESAHRTEGAEGHGPRRRNRTPVLARLDGYLLVLYGDSPLLRAETLRRLIHARAAAMPLRPAHRIMEDPTGYGRVIHDAVARRRRRRAQRPARPSSLPSASQHGHLLLRADLFWKHAAS